MRVDKGVQDAFPYVVKTFSILVFNFVKIFLKLRLFLLFWFSVITWCHGCTNCVYENVSKCPTPKFHCMCSISIAQNWIKNLFGLELCY